MDIGNLVGMANRIGDFFQSMPDPQQARHDIAQHIRKFWEPRMRHELLTQLDDASTDALAVARANAQRLDLPVQWRHGHWLNSVEGRFDLIVSNPPYIAEDDPHLPALRHEPRQALVSGPDGLDDLRQIVGAAPQHLRAGGWLLLEHGHDQADAVRGLLTRAGFVQVQSRDDLAGIARCSGGQWPGVE